MLSDDNVAESNVGKPPSKHSSVKVMSKQRGASVDKNGDAMYEDIVPIVDDSQDDALDEMMQFEPINVENEDQAVQAKKPSVRGVEDELREEYS